MVIISAFLLIYCGGQKKKIEQIFDEAQQMAGQQKFNEAIELYKQVIDGFPKSDKTAQAQFLIAFILSENLKDYAAAEQEYARFIEIYPNHELVESAKFQKEHLGKPLEELPFFKDSLNLREDSIVHVDSGS